MILSQGCCLKQCGKYWAKAIESGFTLLWPLEIPRFFIACTLVNACNSGTHKNRLS